MERCEDIEWLCNLLVGADHLLISRLVVLCETSLLALLSLRNVGQVPTFFYRRSTFHVYWVLLGFTEFY